MTVIVIQQKDRDCSRNKYFPLFDYITSTHGTIKIIEILNLQAYKECYLTEIQPANSNACLKSLLVERNFHTNSV